MPGQPTPSETPDLAHICLVSSLYPPNVIGGAEKYVRGIAEAFADRGHEVSVLTTRSTSETEERIVHERVDGVEVYRVAPLNLYAPVEYREQPSWKKPIHHAIDLWNPHTYLLVRKLLDRIDPDVVHTHNFEGFSPSVFTAIGNRPLVHTLHDYRLLHINNALFKNGSVVEPGPLMEPFQYLNRGVLEPNLDHVIGPSEFIIEKHRNEGFFKGIPATRVRNGVVMPKVRPTEKDPDRGFRVLYAGQLTEQKGIDLLVEAFRRFDPPNARLNVLGKGPLRASLEREARSDERITFHGFVSEERLEEFYRRADVTVVPSRWYDNSPMVIYESYARSTPVIGANIGGIPELLDEGVTGFVFQPDDVESLVSTLGRAYQELSTEFYRAAYRRSQTYSRNDHVADLISIYQKYAIEISKGHNQPGR